MKKYLKNKLLALNLLANAIYRYTFESFSGQLLCSDLINVVVQTGRKFLEHTVSMIEQNIKWSAKVIYDDTGNLFIYQPDKTKEDACFPDGQ